MGSRELVKRLHSLFDEADVIIGHNSDKFDIKMCNGFFLEKGLKPPSPYRSLDTLKIIKKISRENSNKLNDLGVRWRLGQKVDTGGFKLWLACLKGNKHAWAQMKKYNKQDVALLESVYKKIIPWVNLKGMKWGVDKS